MNNSEQERMLNTKKGLGPEYNPVPPIPTGQTVQRTPKKRPTTHGRDPSPPEVVITSVSIGLPAALYAWLRLLCKGPMHRDYLCPFEADSMGDRQKERQNSGSDSGRTDFAVLGCMKKELLVS